MGIKEQHESLDELAALTDDRDKWQARAKQAEGRVATLGQELAAVTANRDGLGNRIHETESERDQWRARWMQADTKAASLAEELAAATRQLEAAVTAPDLRGDLERVAAERDAAREEVRGLQVRAEQAEGDARNATAKMRHVEREAARWQAQAESKNSLLLKAEGAVNALQVVIMNLVREVSNHDD